MTDSRWDTIQSLFLAAVDLDPPSRDAYLNDASRDDDSLRGEVESLLRGAGAPDDPLASAVAEAAREFATLVASSRVGERVGAYRLIDVIGHGGMGTVYLAERADDAYRARVAIKFVRGAHAAPDLARRFLAERQILADLDHSGIARLLDGGATIDGTPYLVLEFVAGAPIDAWCEDHRAGIRERVELMLKVCDAVQYAHDARVVHRDLKPSNILVRDDGSPKLVDFGIARLLSDTAGTETATALRVLTPAYASPEQVRGKPATVASDVYSLGVVLYQLLAGRPPFDLSGASAGEVERRICDQIPVSLSRAAVNRDRAWRDELAGDLEKVVAKALRKRVDQRHPTVAALANDLRAALVAPPGIHRLRRRWRRVTIDRRFIALAAAAAATVMTAVGMRTLAARRATGVAFRFLPVQDVPAPVPVPFKIVNADVNGDGRGDLVWSHLGPAGNQVAVGLGQRNGTVVMQRPLPVPNAGLDADFQLVTGDFNGDGRDDLVWTRARNLLSNVAWVGFANTDATFQFHGPTTLGGETTRWANGWNVYVGDLDGDGSDDLVFNHLTAKNLMWTFRSLRYGTFEMAGPITHPAQGWGGYRAFLADVNGDGRADMVWNDVPVWANRTWVARSRGGGFDFLPQQDHSVTDGWSNSATHIADFDGDSISDIVWARPEEGSMSVYATRGRPSGTFELMPLQRFRLPGVARLASALSGDFNGDGRADLAWNGDDRRLWVMPGTATATPGIAAARTSGPIPGELGDWSAYDVLVFDVNGDQRDDITWIDRLRGRLYVALAG
jgi:serine/threonine protein kinase